MHSLELKVLSVLRREAGVAAGSLGVVSVSGGPDSMALLRLLVAVAPRMKLQLEVAHFNHGLRPESGREAVWVTEAAHRFGLPIHVRATRHLAALTSGTQAAARAWRREELTRLAVQTGAAWIATGHQLDDHLETLLLKLLRGAHLSHLRGMDVRRPIDTQVYANHEIAWVRPVLHVKRTVLQVYLKNLKQPWLEDPTNTSPRYKRNRVRAELLPLLDELAGGAIGARLLALERQSIDLASLLDAEVNTSKLDSPSQRAVRKLSQSRPLEALHWLEIAGLLRLPALAQGVALYRFILERLPGELEYSRIEEILDLLHRPRPGREGVFRVDLPHGRLVRRAGGRLWLEARGPAKAPAREPGK